MTAVTIIIILLVIILAYPVITLQSSPGNEERSHPAKDGQPTKYAPGQSLALGMNIHR